MNIHLAKTIHDTTSNVTDTPLIQHPPAAQLTRLRHRDGIDGCKGRVRSHRRKLDLGRRAASAAGDEDGGDGVDAEGHDEEDQPGGEQRR